MPVTVKRVLLTYSVRFAQNLDLASSNPDLKVSTQEELKAQGAMRPATDFKLHRMYRAEVKIIVQQV
jgi:hypothetical protein